MRWRSGSFRSGTTPWALRDAGQRSDEEAGDRAGRGPGGRGYAVPGRRGGQRLSRLECLRAEVIDWGCGTSVGTLIQTTVPFCETSTPPPGRGQSTIVIG